jgi:hypothetical protein
VAPTIAAVVFAGIATVESVTLSTRNRTGECAVFEGLLILVGSLVAAEGETL